MDSDRHGHYNDDIGLTHNERHVVRHFDRRLDMIEQMLEFIIRQNTHTQQGEMIIMSDLSSITAAVERDTAIDSSAITLINGLAQQIRDSATDPAALQALADQLDASANDLAAAVTANTPAEVPVDPNA